MQKAIKYHPREKTISMVETRLRKINEATRLLVEMAFIDKHELTTDDLRIIAERLQENSDFAKHQLFNVKRLTFKLGEDDA